MVSTITTPFGFAIGRRPTDSNHTTRYSVLRPGETLMVICRSSDDDATHMTVAIKPADADEVVSTEHEVLIPCPRHATDDTGELRLVQGDIRLDMSMIMGDAVLIFVGNDEIRRWFFGDVERPEGSEITTEQRTEIIRFVKLLRAVGGTTSDKDIIRVVGQHYDTYAQQVAEFFYTGAVGDDASKAVNSLLAELRTFTPTDESITNAIMAIVRQRFDSFLALVKNED